MSQLSTENKKKIYRLLRTMYMSIRAINRKYSMRAYHIPGYTPRNGISHTFRYEKSFGFANYR